MFQPVSLCHCRFLNRLWDQHPRRVGIHYHTLINSLRHSALYSACACMYVHVLNSKPHLFEIELAFSVYPWAPLTCAHAQITWLWYRYLQAHYTSLIDSININLMYNCNNIISIQFIHQSFTLYKLTLIQWYYSRLVYRSLYKLDTIQLDSIIILNG